MKKNKNFVPVSIPQAVSAVATSGEYFAWAFRGIVGFNTASGKCCCNDGKEVVYSTDVVGSFNTASGKCCCNLEAAKTWMRENHAFQYRKR